ncbi:cytochrome P450 6j1-like isoform X2 [Cimex lectularius]|nr:cytochrome P450 6j1-like isoform X2 [Cimex lectularius]
MLQIFLVLAVIALAVYQWLTWHYDYWQKIGVRYIQPKLFFGNLKDSILNKENVGVIYKNLYWVYPDEPAVGLFKGRLPQLMVKDLDLIKSVLVKEFNSFHDPDVNVDTKSNPVLALNPFVIKGERWKTIRSIHTQRQTTLKIKAMFAMIEEVTRDMLKFIEEKQNVEIEGKYFAGQFTTDVVGSCVFGLKTNSFLDPNAEFRKMSLKILQPDTTSNMAFLLSSHAPWLAKLLKLKIINDEVVDYFVKIVLDMYEYRLKNNVSRNDYLGSLMENNKSEKPMYSVQEICGHSLTFLLDGYETSSTVMGFMLCCLSLHQDVQKKLRDEISKVENLDYDTIHSLPYLDAVINETLRLFPPGSVLSRECTQDIVLKSGGRDYPLRRGMTVTVPVYAMHTDPKYFPDPEKFNPDRFYKQNAPPYFFPFGLGPRACLGQRFALTQIKTAAAHIFKNYKVLPVEGKEKMPDINPKSPFLLMPKDPMLFKFSKI